MTRGLRIVLSAALVAAAALACDARAGRTAPAEWPGVVVLMYHKVDAKIPAHDAVGRDLTVEPAAFEAQLRYLRDHRVAAMTAHDLAAAIARGERPRDAVVLTFDDGYDDAATTALPIMRRYGIRGTFYVSSGFIGTPRHLSWAQMRALRDAGMEVACHGTYHLDLSRLDLAGQRAEIGGCLRRFARYLGGVPPDTYAYPAGQFDGTTLSLMAREHMRAAFTEFPGVVTTLARPYELPRRRIRHDDDLARFAALIRP